MTVHCGPLALAIAVTLGVVGCRGGAGGNVARDGAAGDIPPEGATEAGPAKDVALDQPAGGDAADARPDLHGDGALASDGGDAGAPLPNRTTGIWYSTWYTPALWGDWGINYVPVVPGGDRQYDSGEAAVIDSHLAMIADARIDFLLLDLTNHIGTDFILMRAKALCGRLVAWNAAHPDRPVRYAIAVGATQWTKDPADIEAEATSAWTWFVQAFGDDNYFRWDGKPLLVANDQGVRAPFTAYAPKPNASRFTLKWWNGNVGASSVPVVARGDYLGWAFIDGALANQEAMVVMPGWRNRAGNPPVSRFLNGEEAGFYKHRGWERVLAAPPRLVVINSFNEFAENTGVEPARTDKLSGLPGQEAWSAPSLYWDLTRHYNLLYKGLPAP
jgi:hypothetical protein